MPGPLHGIRVLDLTIWQQGTVAGAMLADMGADVVKIEGPDSPDPGRWTQPSGKVANGYFETNNRNKRGLVIDLKQPAAREAFYRMVGQADVFLTNLRIAAVERLGITYPELSAHNPRLIYAHGTGYGAAGPDARQGSMDIMAQARGGVMSMNAEPDSGPITVGVPFADQTGAAMLAWGIVLSLFHRERTGEGQMVNSSLLAGQMFAQGYAVTNYLFSGQQRTRAPRTRTYPLWNRYRAGDDRWFVIGMPNPHRWWARFCRAIERPELEHDAEHGDIAEHPENYPATIRYLDALFATQPRQHWLDRFRAADLFFSPVADYEELASDPQVEANKLIVDYEHPIGPLRMLGLPVDLSRSPGAITRPAPEFGQHSEEVLLDYGFSWDEIGALRDEGLIGPRSHGAEAESLSF
jgi:crotonobetainyl-CoA:carnitine CoA-transferase CaiB-like acyl-CoA transferase